MIKRVNDEVTANICDKLLSKLIKDEKQYNKNIVDSFEVKDYFKNIIQNTNNILLCFEEENIVKGYVFFKEIKDDNAIGYLIDGLYVLEKYRNCGIGTKLINEGMKLLKNKNISFIDVNVMFKNKKAINIYKTFGFEEFRYTMRKCV